MLADGVHYMAIGNKCLYVQTKPEACFPVSATVEVRGGRRVRMDALETGAEVLAADGRYSRVVAWTHRDIRARGTYMRVTLRGGASLTATVGHSRTSRAGLCGRSDAGGAGWHALASALAHTATDKLK